MRALFICLLIAVAGVAAPAFSKGDTVVPVKADDASFARLPRFKLRSQPAYVFLTNGIDLLNAVASKSDQARAEKKGAKYISGKVAIWIDKFEAGIECDAPYFDAHFLRVAPPPSRVAFANMPEEGC